MRHLTGDAGARGFTLLEILVALVVLGFLLVALTQGVHFGLAAWRTQARMTAERGDIDAVDRALRTLVVRLDPGGPAEPALLHGDARSVTFTTELPMATARLPIRLADVTVAVDEAHRLSMFSVPHIRNWLVPAPAPDRADLLAGVDHIELSYWQRATAKTPAGWVGAWTGRDPPALLRIRIVFPAASRVSWPDIVIAPMRERPRA